VNHILYNNNCLICVYFIPTDELGKRYYLYETIPNSKLLSNKISLWDTAVYVWR